MNRNWTLAALAAAAAVGAAVFVIRRQQPAWTPEQLERLRFQRWRYRQQQQAAPSPDIEPGG